MSAHQMAPGVCVNPRWPGRGMTGVARPNTLIVMPLTRCARSLLTLMMCLSLFSVSLHVRAEPQRLPVPGITGADNRVISDSRRYPWSAVGRLNITTGGFCTATVIGPRQVLTAAHCLWNKRTGRWLPPCALHFLAGYQLQL